MIICTTLIAVQLGYKKGRYNIGIINRKINWKLH